MENQQNQTQQQPQVQAQTQEAPPVAEQQPGVTGHAGENGENAEKKSNLLDTVKSALAKQKAKFAKLSLSPAGFRPPKKLIVGVVAGLVVVLLIAVVASIILKNSGVSMPGEVVPTPTPTPTDEPSQPSEYANDPEVLEIIEKLQELEKTLNETAFREDILRIPSLDWNVTF